MYYLVELRVSRPESAERAAQRGDVYLSPEGNRGWILARADNEEALRRSLQNHEVEEVRPVLPAREYVEMQRARQELEQSKSRFVDDPTGALAEARHSVLKVIEGRGYGAPERTDGQEILREYDATEIGEGASLEERREAFGRLERLLDRLSRT
jgi:hypothetical protein